MAAEQCTDRVDALRDAYFDEIEQVAPEDLIFIDETGTNQAMTPMYGKAPKGRRLYEVRPVQRGRLYTIIGALGFGGMLTAMCVEGGTTSEVFYAFVDQLLCRHLRPGHVVVLDRLPAHRRKDVRELIEAKGARLILLPPYSPELNPIEQAWSKLKNIIKKHRPRSMHAIDLAVAAALPTVTGQDAKGWFKHCGIDVYQN